MESQALTVEFHPALPVDPTHPRWQSVITWEGMRITGLKCVVEQEVEGITPSPLHQLWRISLYVQTNLVRYHVIECSVPDALRFALDQVYRAISSGGMGKWLTD